MDLSESQSGTYLIFGLKNKIKIVLIPAINRVSILLQLSRRRTEYVLGFWISVSILNSESQFGYQLCSLTYDDKIYLNSNQNISCKCFTRNVNSFDVGTISKYKRIQLFEGGDHSEFYSIFVVIDGVFL